MMLNIKDPRELSNIGKFTYILSAEDDEFDIPCYVFRAQFNGTVKSTIKIYREFNSNRLICIHYWVTNKNTHLSRQHSILKADFNTMNLRTVLEALIKKDQLEIL